MRRWIGVALLTGSLVWSACGGESAATTEAPSSTPGATTPPADVTTTSNPPVTTVAPTPTTAPTPIATTTAPPATTTTTEMAMAAIDAEALLTQYCAACHGAEMEGGIGPALAGGHAGDHGAEELFEVIANGRGEMPAWGGVLSDDEIDAIVAYIEATQGHE